VPDSEGETRKVEIQSPWYPNYVVCALERFATFGSRTALTQQNRSLTYTEARQLVLDLAARLRALDVRSGSVVGVFMGLRIESPLLQLALHLVGARSVWVDVTAMPNEVDQYLKLAPPDVLIYDTVTTAESGAALGRRLGARVLCLGPGGDGPDLLDFDRAARHGEPAAAEPESIFQTSGTTGTPKSVHHKQVFYAQLGELADELVATDQWRIRHLSFSRLSHPAGQISSLLYLFSGGTMIFVPGFEPGELIAAAARERATSVYMAPPMFYQILDHPSLADADLSSLTTFNVGGSAMNPTRLRQGIDRFGPILRVTYGLSESPFISAYPGVGTDPDRLGSCGRAYGDVRVEIRDAEGHVVKPGETGEIYATSKLRFVGYWGRPDLTERAIVDGWVRTGDLGYLVDGQVVVCGRRKDVIIMGGRNIYPTDIERAALSVDGVRAGNAVAVRLDAGTRRERFAVAVESTLAGNEEAERTLTKEITSKVVDAVGMRPVGVFVLRAGSLPKTPSGKLRRSAAAAWVSEKLLG